jgi:hypothetical protein
MLKVNVGLSRKLSRDFNSQGFTVNLEGEVNANLSDAEAVVERIQEYYDLAEEVLLRQIDRHESDAAIASRDGGTAQVPLRQSLNSPAATEPPAPSTTAQAKPANSPKSAEPATNKQIQFLLNLSKRFGLATPQLESRIAEIIGHKLSLYDLTKRDAGIVLDTLTADSKKPPAAARR